MQNKMKVLSLATIVFTGLYSFGNGNELVVCEEDTNTNKTNTTTTAATTTAREEALSCLAEGLDNSKFSFCERFGKTFSNFESCANVHSDCTFKYPLEQCLEVKKHCKQIECKPEENVYEPPDIVKQMKIECEDESKLDDAKLCMNQGFASPDLTMCDMFEIVYENIAKCVNIHKRCKYRFVNCWEVQRISKCNELDCLRLEQPDQIAQLEASSASSISTTTTTAAATIILILCIIII